MTDHGETDGSVPPIYLLLWDPPARCGRFVVGGWCLEAWRASYCTWRMELAGLGAYFWVDADLAKVVAARVLRGQNVVGHHWAPSGSGSELVFLARPDGARLADQTTRAEPVPVLGGRGRYRPVARTGTAVM